MSIGSYGLVVTTLKFDDKVLTTPDSELLQNGQVNLKIRYFGCGNAIGVTRINSGGHYDRLPYPFKPSWGAREWVAILSHTIIPVISVLGYVYFVFLKEPKKENNEK